MVGVVSLAPNTLGAQMPTVVSVGANATCVISAGKHRKMQFVLPVLLVKPGPTENAATARKESTKTMLEAMPASLVQQAHIHGQEKANAHPAMPVSILRKLGQVSLQVTTVMTASARAKTQTAGVATWGNGTKIRTHVLPVML